MNAVAPDSRPNRLRPRTTFPHWRTCHGSQLCDQKPSGLETARHRCFLVSEFEHSSGWHPFSGLFPGVGAGSLPRFTATSPARPGLTVGSTLDGGPDWADGAIARDGRLVAREVDRVIVALVPGPAAPIIRVTGPVLGPPDLLLVAADVAGFAGRVPAVGNGECDPYQGVL